MVTVELTCRPAFWPWKRTFRKKFPTAYSELNEAQFVAIATINDETADDISFLSIMTGIPKGIIRKLGEFQQYKLFEIFSNFGINKPQNSFLIKKIKAGDIEWFLPAEKLKGMSFGQFIFADSLHETWQSTQQPDDLCRFVACIALKAGEVFNENNIDKKAKLLSGVNSNTLQAIAFNWRLVGEWLSEAYPLVFTKSEPGEKVKKINNAWLKIFDSLVDSDIVNADRYANLSVNNVFRYMTQRIKQNMKRKK